MTSFEPVFALANEVDLYTTWIPLILGRFGLKTAVELPKGDGRMRKGAHLYVSLPFPFQDRDIVVSIVGVDMLEKDQVAILINNLVGVVPEAGGVTRVSVSMGGLFVEPCDNGLQGGCIFEVDPKMVTVPEFLVNFAIYTFVPSLWQILNTRLTTLGKPGCKYQERMNTDKDGFYSFIRHRLTVYEKNKKSAK